MNTQIKENISNNIKKLKESDFSVTKFTKDLSYGKKIIGLNAGCYVNHRESFARSTQHLWWSGLIVKRNVEKGEYNLQTINMKEIKNTYGK